MNTYETVLQLKKLRYDYEAGTARQIGERVYEAVKLAAVLLEKINDDDKWISVDSLLPETCDDVLAVDENRYCRVLYYEGGMWYDNIDDSRHECITHWKPVPEPPKRNTRAMAVLEKFPERCMVCPLFFYNNSRTGFCGLLKDWVVEAPEMRDDKCPLIEFPDRHGEADVAEMDKVEI